MLYMFEGKEKKKSDWKKGKRICCCKLERLNSFVDLIRFLKTLSKGSFIKFYKVALLLKS